jgi:hypothetical protein
MTSDEDTTEEEQAAIDLAFGDLALEEMDDGKPKLDEENKILKTPQELMEEKIARRLQEDARNAEELKKMEEILQKNM